jgi:hypothetical protein
MPAAIDPIIKQRVIAQYLQGVSRDTIAADNGIATGTVSNIIDEWKQRVQDSDYESIRELSVFCRMLGQTSLLPLPLKEVKEWILRCDIGLSSLCPTGAAELSLSLDNVHLWITTSIADGSVPYQWNFHTSARRIVHVL